MVAQPCEAYEQKKIVNVQYIDSLIILVPNGAAVVQAVEKVIK